MPKEMKSYPAPWQGKLILACRKCQKKLKKSDDLKPLANLKKTIKAQNKRFPEAPLHILNVPCMDLCPKDAVTICIPSQADNRLRILRTEDDIQNL